MSGRAGLAALYATPAATAAMLGWVLSQAVSAVPAALCGFAAFAVTAGVAEMCIRLPSRRTADTTPKMTVRAEGEASCWALGSIVRLIDEATPGDRFARVTLTVVSDGVAAFYAAEADSGEITRHVLDTSDPEACDRAYEAGCAVFISAMPGEALETGGGE